MNVEIYKPEDCIEQMTEELLNGKVKGTTTHNSEIDEAWTWRKKESNGWTGYNNQGKGEFIKQLCLIKALEEDWKFMFYSPEDYHPVEFFDGFIHTLSGQSTDKDRRNYIDLDLYKACYERIKNNFVFVYIKPPDNNLENVLEEFTHQLETFDADAAFIDPILKLAKSKKAPERDHDYAGFVTSMLDDYSVRYNLSMHIVMHQLTPKKNEKGLYPKPDVYAIKGGGSYADGLSNVLFVERPNYAIDKQDETVIFGSQKIKKQKLVGLPQELTFKFNRMTNRYVSMEGRDMFNFEKHRQLCLKSIPTNTSVLDQTPF